MFVPLSSFGSSIGSWRSARDRSPPATYSGAVIVSMPHHFSRRNSIKYVGHAQRWDSVELSRSLEARGCVVTYKSAGRMLAVTTIGRDLQNLKAESAMEMSSLTARKSLRNQQ